MWAATCPAGVGHVVGGEVKMKRVKLFCVNVCVCVCVCVFVCVMWKG